MTEAETVFAKWLKMSVADQVEGIRDVLSISHPEAVTELFEFWDARTSKTHTFPEGQMVIELFWAGELAEVKDKQRFIGEVCRILGQSNIEAETPFPMREGGCMMPLTAVALAVNDDNARRLGELIFDDFGNPKPDEEEDDEDFDSDGNSSDSEDGSGPRKEPECKQQ